MNVGFKRPLLKLMYPFHGCGSVCYSGDKMKISALVKPAVITVRLKTLILRCPPEEVIKEKDVPSPNKHGLQ